MRLSRSLTNVVLITCMSKERQSYRESFQKEAGLPHTARRRRPAGWPSRCQFFRKAGFLDQPPVEVAERKRSADWRCPRGRCQRDWCTHN